jgi:hypothetical protein
MVEVSSVLKNKEFSDAYTLPTHTRAREEREIIEKEISLL